MTPQQDGPVPSDLSDWLCRLTAHDSYGARLDWQCFCAGEAAVANWSSSRLRPGATRSTGGR